MYFNTVCPKNLSDNIFKQNDNLKYSVYSIKGVKVSLLNKKKKQKSLRSVFKFQRNRIKMKQLKS